MPEDPHHDLDLTATVLHVFRQQRAVAERALAQVGEEDFFARAGAEDPLAIVVKHVGGNLRSRWRDFLTTDGEKPDRRRDGEFELVAGDTRAALESLWADGWGELERNLGSLEPDDWERTVTIRGEPHSVLEAALRSLAHTSYHVGQIVERCRRLAGSDWTTLSIPRGASEGYRPAPSSLRSTGERG